MSDPISKCKTTKRKACKSRNPDAASVRDFFLLACSANIIKAVSEMIDKQDVASLLRVEAAILESPNYECR